MRFAVPNSSDANGRDQLVGRDMLCFSHDWTGDPLSKTHLMRLLAHDNRILWVNSIGYRTPSLGNKRDLGRIVQKLRAATEAVREVERNIFVLNPLSVPAFGNRLLRGLNSRSLRWQVRRAIEETRLQEPCKLGVQSRSGRSRRIARRARIIYYCVDEYTAFHGVDSAGLRAHRAMFDHQGPFDNRVGREAIEPRNARHTRALLIRHRVDYDHFASTIRAETAIPEDLARLPKPVIGYFGLIADDWVDIPLLVHVGRSFPTGSLVMLGKTTMDVSALEHEPNIHLLGRRPYASLPGYCKGFDVAIIPFPVNEVTLNANPLKAREYLAAGLPVVSTAIPEVEVLGQCLIGRTQEEFVSRIREALLSAGPSATRSRSMESESWAARVEEIRRQWPTMNSPSSPASRVEEDRK